ncbi:MAG: hypothetical protein HZA03_11405 [Nitrospinae bacterium]|nr:hypothetical protein [Nitrospinota bacterium]
MKIILGFLRTAGIMLAALAAAGFYMHYSLLAATQYTPLFQALVLGTSVLCLIAGLTLIFLMRLVLVAVPMLLMLIVSRMGGMGGAGGGFTWRGGDFGGPFN